MDEDMITAYSIALGELEGGVFNFDRWEWESAK